MRSMGGASKVHMDTMLASRTRLPMPAKLPHTIVLAWCTTRWNGIRHVAIAHACVWKNNVGAGEKSNVERMLRDDQIETADGAIMRSVFAYPSSEPDPLGKTRETMLRRYEILR